MFRTSSFFTTRMILAAVVGLFLAISYTLPVYALSVRVTPTDVPVDLWYHGAKITIAGNSKVGDSLIFKVSTAPAEVTVKYLGKTAGMWMKKGDLRFKQVPGVYLLYSTGDLKHLLTDEERGRNMLGYDTLEKQAVIDGPMETGDAATWFQEFIKLKEHEHLYHISEESMVRHDIPTDNQKDNYNFVMNWPYQAPPGTYTVEVMAVRDGRIVERAEGSIKVEQTGIMATLSKIAFQKSAIYGIMAIGIAMIAGLAVGLLFKKGGGSH